MPELAFAAGRPVKMWIALFALCSAERGGEWERLAWPDGGALLTQPWLQVRIFEVLRDELRTMAGEEARRSAGRA